MNTEHGTEIELVEIVPYSHKIKCQGFCYLHLFALLLATNNGVSLPHMSYNPSAHLQKENFKNGMEAHST